MALWETPYARAAVTGQVVLPGSKSLAARALVLALLADGPSSLAGLPDGRDTKLMLAALRAFGAQTDVGETTRVVPPLVPEAAKPIDCGLAGTLMRFLPPVALLSSAPASFYGDAAAAIRPVRPLLDALRTLGAKVDGDALPFSVRGPLSHRTHQVTIDSSASSQFVSGLLLGAARFPAGLEITHEGRKLPSRPHIQMTLGMLRAFGVHSEEFAPNQWQVPAGRVRATELRIEPDLTAAATFLAAALATGGTVTAPWPEPSLQAGDELLAALAAFGARVTFAGTGARREVSVSGDGGLHGAEIDLGAVGELA
ncbi:MAG: 3-phosphoshikimate 1-carboxyvinyltransferase, partial [Propionibacteriaceae bacterium]|nr:3-phosphoshikimate 1-carboxyvinyltransferase [Propionibacteriaceae bacterium]